MAIALSFSNVFQFFSAIAPFLLIFLMVMVSIFNSDIKGLIYLLGIILSFVFTIMLQSIIRYNPAALGKEVSTLCKIFALPNPIGGYSSPSFNSVMIAFTFIYLFIPMDSNNVVNYPLLICILGIFIIDAFTRMKGNCTNAQGIILGGVLGLILGAIWYNILKITGNDSLLYYDEYVSDKVACSRPEKQTFKCAVYKNGELLKTI
tara:strand:- start:3791 stop:4405 length:615 start_codon:yes stop_codon:yes gene_type:complete